MTITTLGIDLAKSVFQLHGIDANGVVVSQKKLRRGAVLSFLSKLGPCLIGMEACATSHYWAREIAALGHDVRLIPPAYVKPMSNGKGMMPPTPSQCSPEVAALTLPLTIYHVGVLVHRIGDY